MPEKSTHPIVFFDGDCGFCHHGVRWILKRDRAHYFRFASLGSPLGQAFLRERSLDVQHFKTIILYHPSKAYYTQSTAIAMILLKLKGWKLAGYALKYLPVFLRDWVYQQVAIRRKSIIQTCPLPTFDEKIYFLWDKE